MSQIELFDYSALTPEVRSEVSAATERIKLRMKRTAEDIIEIGKDLIAVKERLPHGRFLPWLESEFGMNIRTAQRFMQVAEKFPAECDIMSHLKPSVVYALAAPSTPDEVIDKAIEKAESGESLTVAEIKRLKEEAKALEQRNKDLAKVVKSERDKNDQLSFKLQKTEEELGVIAESKNREFQVTLSEEIERAKSELEKTIERQNDVIQKQQAEFERFKENPDPETKRKIQEAHDALVQLEGDRRQAESRLNELRTQEDHARTNAIKVTRLKGALEKVMADHADGVIAISSPYMTESLLCDAETLANALHDFASRIEQSIDASRQGDRQAKTVEVEVL